MARKEEKTKQKQSEINLFKMFEQTNKQTLNFMMAAIAANLGVWAQQCERRGQSGDGNSHTRTHTETLPFVINFENTNLQSSSIWI